MAIHSYSQPSTSNSRTSETIPMSIQRRRPREDIWGIPSRCLCGRWLVLKTSRTDLNPGRRFYACEESENGLFHSFKWWDEAIMEEIQGLRCDITYEPKFENLNRDLRTMAMEIEKLKKLLEEKESVASGCYGGGFVGFGKKNAMLITAGLMVSFGMIIYFMMP